VGCVIVVCFCFFFLFWVRLLRVVGFVMVMALGFLGFLLLSGCRFVLGCSWLVSLVEIVRWL